MEGSDKFTHTNTLLDRSKLVSTREELAKLKDFVNKTDVIESCSRERLITKWRFYKLTNLTVFAASLKKSLWVAKMLFFLNLCWKITQSTVSRMKRIQDSHIVTTCAFFVLLLSICMEINDWKKKHLKILTCSWVECMDSALVSSMESIWTTFQLLKICYYSMFSMISIL